MKTHLTPRSVVALGGLTLTLLATACGQSSAAHSSAGTTPSPLVVAAMTPSPSPARASGCSGGPTVTTDTQLALALSSATAGTSIIMAAGTYSGQFVAEAQGTADAPIYLCGSRDAVIDGGDIKSGYALYMHGASYWHLEGFTIQGGQKGVVTDHASHLVISGLFVHDVGDEAIHLRSFSSDNIVEGNVVRTTGLHSHFFGEGIYVGSANKNWCKYSACGPDQSDRNIIRNNDISETTAENIDIKEGTSGGTIVGNQLSGVGMDPSGASAWVNLKGNGWTVVGNVGLTSVKDGFQVHEVYAGWGRNNVFRQNQASVDGPGYGYYVQHQSLGTVVACDNTVSGAALGLSNGPCAN
jgi:Right handed beta helix region